MLRALVVPLNKAEGDIDKLNGRLGVPLGFVELLELSVQQPPVLEQLVPGKHLLASTTSSQSSIWFQTKGQERVALTNAGCSIEDPLADLLYNLAMLPAVRISSALMHTKFISVRWPTKTFPLSGQFHLSFVQTLINVLIDFRIRLSSLLSMIQQHQHLLIPALLLESRHHCPIVKFNIHSVDG